MACVPTNSMILVILNPWIEDCDMRKRAWLLAQIAQHEKNLRAVFDYIHPYRPRNEFILL